MSAATKADYLGKAKDLAEEYADHFVGYPGRLSDLTMAIAGLTIAAEAAGYARGISDARADAAAARLIP